MEHGTELGTALSIVGGVFAAALLAAAVTSAAGGGEDEKMEYRQLTPAEKRVIVDSGKVVDLEKRKQNRP